MILRPSSYAKLLQSITQPKQTNPQPVQLQKARHAGPLFVVGVLVLFAMSSYMQKVSAQEHYSKDVVEIIDPTMRIGCFGDLDALNIEGRIAYNITCSELPLQQCFGRFDKDTTDGQSSTDLIYECKEATQSTLHEQCCSFNESGRLSHVFSPDHTDRILNAHNNAGTDCCVVPGMR